MPLFSRPDATLVPSVHPVRRIMPFLVPSRNGAFVLFEQEVAAEPARQTLERLNAGRPPERAITLFHLVLRAIGLALASTCGHSPTRAETSTKRRPPTVPDVLGNSRTEGARPA